MQQNILLFVIAAGAIVTDLREKKIKNKWVFCGGILGLLVKSYCDGIMGFFSSFWGILIPILVLWGAFCMRQIGAGDVKLFSALGSLLGMENILECMMVAMIFGIVSEIAGRVVCGKKKKDKRLRLAVPIFFSVLCRIGGVY